MSLLVVLALLARSGPAPAAAQGLEPLPAKIVQAGTAGDFNQFRKILASPTVNTPEPFQGFGGWCGWPDVCRLQNGDLFVAYSAGYWHASWPTPLDMPAGMVAQWGVGWLAEWNCPTGGKMVWIRSRDNGKTWTRPKAFPVVPGCYYVSDMLQLRNGAILAAAVRHTNYGFWDQMPTTPLEYARMAANRFPIQNILFRSDDNGETWQETGRITELSWVDAIYSLIESPDGSLLAVYNAWPLPRARAVTVVARSQDQGKSWSTLSVFGSNDFDTLESLVGYLPDGSLGCIARPHSTWYQSFDHGRTWSAPRQFSAGSGHLFSRGSMSITPDGVVVVAYCSGPDGHGRVVYSRDGGKTWIRPGPGLGFAFDPLAYYPDTCVLADGSIFAVGSHEGLGKNEYGPAGAEVTAMRFRIKSQSEGEGIELLPIDGPQGK
ncbi:MAG: exo-alpha-sialidase [Pirellulales bacterium]|nr:exo-alpha-sialidase [Pirellulales bacterium]